MCKLQSDRERDTKPITLVSTMYLPTRTRLNWKPLEYPFQSNISFFFYPQCQTISSRAELDLDFGPPLLPRKGYLWLNNFQEEKRKI